MDMFTILACPQCTYDRLAPTWTLFLAIRLIVIMLIARGYLDLVRILGLFTLYEFIYLVVWKFLIQNSHPGLWNETIEWLALAALFILCIGVPAAAVMWGASKIRYFRKPDANRLSLRRALLLIPCIFLIMIAQGIITSYID